MLQHTNRYLATNIEPEGDVEPDENKKITRRNSHNASFHPKLRLSLQRSEVNQSTRYSYMLPLSHYSFEEVPLWNFETKSIATNVDEFSTIRGQWFLPILYYTFLTIRFSYPVIFIKIYYLKWKENVNLRMNLFHYIFIY